MQNLKDYINSAIEKETKVFEAFGEALKTYKQYDIVHGYIDHSTAFQCDGIINKEEKAWAVIEVKQQINEHTFEQTKKNLRRVSGILNVRHVILTDSNEYYISPAWDFEKWTYKKTDFHSVIEQILNEDNKQIPLEKYATEITNILKKYGIEGIKIGPNNLSYQSKYNSVLLDSDTELELLQKMLGKRNGKCVTRFTSLDSLFSTLNYESFRMMALDGMNDKEDGEYFKKTLYDETIYSQLSELNETSFIISYSLTEVTDLNMWRLYANDTAGVCVEMEIKNPNKDDGFILAEVIYGDKNQKTYIHCLKEIVEICKPYNFILNNWNVWRAIFKDGDYAVEKEVRLLYLKSLDKTIYKDNDDQKSQYNEGWVLTNDCKIFSEYVDFKGDRAQNLPLKIKKIFLGPNSPEPSTNQRQVQAMLKEHSMLLAERYSGKEVEISNINSYRTSKK